MSSNLVSDLIQRIRGTAPWMLGPQNPDAAMYQFEERLQERERVRDLGVEVFPGVRMPRSRERQGTLMFGAPGCGKTQLMTVMMHSAQMRGDRMVVVDTKGDMTVSLMDDLTYDGLAPPVLVAPHDSRSWIWLPADDLNDSADAIELAHLLVPEMPGERGFFPKAARAILAVCIIELMKVKERDWTWSTLFASTFRPLQELIEAAQRYLPVVAPLLSVHAEQQTSGIRGSIANSLMTFFILSEAWSDPVIAKHPERRFSITDFLLGKRQNRTLILQRSARYDTLSQFWISTFLTIMGRMVPSMPDQTDRVVDNPTWFFIDEFGQLPRMDIFLRVFRLGRDRGIRTVLALQDKEQLTEIYGAGTRDEFEGSFGTKFIGRIGHGENATRIASSFGEVQEYHYKWMPSGHGGSRHDEVARQTPVLNANDLATQLGADLRRKRCTFLVTGLSCGPAEVHTPIQSRPKFR